MASSSQVTGNGWEEWPDKGGPTSLSDHTNTTTKPSTPGKTPIDSLSREELIKHIKKQTILLQKMKGRTEELSKECNKLKEELRKQPEVAPSNNEHLIEEVQILKSERDQSLNEAKQVKLLMLSIEQDHKERTINLEENISTLKYDNSALKEKISQLEVSMATRNDEMNKLNDVIERLTEKNKSMEVEMSSLVKGRDEMEDERRRMKDELERLTIEIDNKASTWSSEKDELMSRARSDLEEQKDNLIIARNDYESLREQKENEIELLKEEKEREAKLLKDKLEELQRELLVNEGVRKEHDKTVESLKKQLDEAQREKENEIHRLSEELMTNKDENDRMKNEMEQIMKSKNVSNEREEHGEGTMVRINDLQLEKEQLVKEMETQSHQHKEEMKKLKAIAVKLKKELSEMKEKEQDGNNLVQQINDKDSAIEELKVSLKDVEENFNK
jgi:chromosome segregation ATPase